MVSQFQQLTLQIKIIAVVRFRAGRFGAGTRMRGWGVGMMGEAGDFKCLTLVKLGPRPSKTGLFFRIKREPRCSAS
jgi:hypothetical protein